MIKIRPIASALTLALYGTGTLDQGLVLVLVLVLVEVIVTAQKRVEIFQDVPIAVQARYRF